MDGEKGPLAMTRTGRSRLEHRHGWLDAEMAECSCSYGWLGVEMARRRDSRKDLEKVKKGHPAIISGYPLLTYDN